MDITVGIPTYNRAEWLRGAIASVLAQSYEAFTLVVSDNASSDNTREVVASFEDTRIRYCRSEHNIGMTGNLNRLIDLAQTEFLVLLCDDDALHPDHLTLTREALMRWPTAGVAHTGSKTINAVGMTIDPHVRLFVTDLPLAFERRRELLRRSMKDGVTVCFSSALIRRSAIVEAGGLREREQPFADVPLMMRIARKWDFAYVNGPLAVCRTHEGAESVAMGWSTPAGFQWSTAFPELLYERKRSFLAEADPQQLDVSHLRNMAERAYRRDRIRVLSMRSDAGRGVRASLRDLWGEIRRGQVHVFDWFTWRFVAGQLGGRHLRRAVRSMRT